MAETAVVNASPLILLSRAGYLRLLQGVAQRIVVPVPVIEEIGAKGAGDPVVCAVASAAWLERVASPSLPAEIASWDLGAGESSVLAWAHAALGAAAILDDREARRCAASLEIPTLGTLAVVLLAKRRGELESARAVLEKLLAVGMFLSPATLEAALRRVGE